MYVQGPPGHVHFILDGRLLHRRFLLPECGGWFACVQHVQGNPPSISCEEMRDTTSLICENKPWTLDALDARVPPAEIAGLSQLSRRVTRPGGLDAIGRVVGRGLFMATTTFGVALVQDLPPGRVVVEVAQAAAWPTLASHAVTSRTQNVPPNRPVLFCESAPPRCDRLRAGFGQSAARSVRLMPFRCESAITPCLNPCISSDPPQRDICQLVLFSSTSGHARGRQCPRG